jgi:hypothetical protein
VFLENPFFLKKLLYNEEILSYIFEHCFSFEKQHFFVPFLNLLYPRLKDESSLLRNLFFDTLRKTFSYLTNYAIEKAENVDSERENWKGKILCQIFQNLLIVNLGDPNFEYFSLQENLQIGNQFNLFPLDYSKLKKNVKIETILKK